MPGNLKKPMRLHRLLFQSNPGNAMTPFSLVDNLTTGMNQPLSLPWAAAISLKGLNLLHFGWWFLKQKKIYLQKNNALPLIIGHSANLLIQNTYIRQGAKFLLVITRAEECSLQTFRLARSCQRLYDSLQGKYAAVVKPSWSKKAAGVFSLHFHNALNRNLAKLQAFAYRILCCTLHIFKSISKLGLHLWDTYDCIYAEQEAMQLAVVNGMKWLDKIRDNREYYLKKLRDSKPYVENIIFSLQLEMDAEEVIKGFEEAVQGAAAVADTLNAISTSSGETISEILIRSLTLAGAALNLLEDVPASMAGHLILEDEPGWEKQSLAEPELHYFPDIKWTTAIRKYPMAKPLPKQPTGPITNENPALRPKKLSAKDWESIRKLTQMDPKQLDSLWHNWSAMHCN